MKLKQSQKELLETIIINEWDSINQNEKKDNVRELMLIELANELELSNDFITKLNEELN